MTCRQQKVSSRKSGFTPVNRAPLLQRKCACGGTPGPDGECADCKKRRLQRKATQRSTLNSSHSEVPGIVHDVLRSPGRPLDQAIRHVMQPRFEHDFSNVRIHTDAQANTSARAVHAQAYTAGSHIVFGQNQYDPHTVSGRSLIAHELTHVAQQSPAESTPLPRHIGDPAGPLEAEAESVAANLSSGARSNVSSMEARSTLHRAPDDAGNKSTNQRRVEVRIAVNGDCAAPEKIAEAIPGARTMLSTAESWFINYPFLVPGQQKFFDGVMQAHFGSSSADTRHAVHGRIIRMARLMESAMNAGVTFDCTAVTAEKCKNHPWSMFVTRGEQNTIHVCPDFFKAGLESRRFTLMHESAHTAGVGDRRYILTAGPIGLSECLKSSGLATDVALDNADSYAWAVWCLTREPGAEILPAVEFKAKGAGP